MGVPEKEKDIFHGQTVGSRALAFDHPLLASRPNLHCQPSNYYISTMNRAVATLAKRAALAAGPQVRLFII